MSVSYPQDIKEAGSSYWGFLHNFASKLPKYPATNDKIQARIVLSNFIKYGVCEECNEDAKVWIKQHPPNLKTNEDFLQWTCEFHNTVNSKLGKAEVACKLNDEGCTDCNGEVKGQEVGKPNDVPSQQTNNKPSPNYNQGIQQPELPSISLEKVTTVVPNRSVSVVPVVPSPTHKYSTFKDFKRISKKIIEDMCKKEEVPVPQIIFEPCPGNHATSCTRVPISVDDGKIQKDMPTKLYLNPHQASPRTTVHEGLHYIAKAKGDDKLFQNELEIDRMARETIEKEFPSNTYSSANGITSYKEVYDTGLSSIFSQTFKERVNNLSLVGRRVFQCLVSYMTSQLEVVGPLLHPHHRLHLLLM